MSHTLHTSPEPVRRVYTQRDIQWACNYMAQRVRGLRTNAEASAVMRASTDPTDVEATRILDASDAWHRAFAMAAAAGDACGSLAHIRPMSHTAEDSTARSAPATPKSAAEAPPIAPAPAAPHLSLSLREVTRRVMEALGDHPDHTATLKRMDRRAMR